MGLDGSLYNYVIHIPLIATLHVSLITSFQSFSDTLVYCVVMSETEGCPLDGGSSLGVSSGGAPTLAGKSIFTF